MTCYECIHKEVCKNGWGQSARKIAEGCRLFKDSGEYVRVVRCKDCAYATDEGMSGIYCDHPDKRNPVGCRETDFCDEGIRREDLPEEDDDMAHDALMSIHRLTSRILCDMKEIERLVDEI